LLIYLILAAAVRKFPEIRVIIMLTVPMAIAGCHAFAYGCCGQTINIFLGNRGMILLIGIVTKNAPFSYCGSLPIRNVWQVMTN